MCEVSPPCLGASKRIFLQAHVRSGRVRLIPSHVVSHGSSALNDEQMLECCRDAGIRGDDRRGAAILVHPGRHGRNGRPFAVPCERSARRPRAGDARRRDRGGVHCRAVPGARAPAGGSDRDAFVAWGERPEADIAASGEVVFVGYGIRAPEWQWDDYKGADLRGKVLLMLVNDPGLVDSTVFLGKILTYYGRWTYKLEEAARQGAAGAILIHTTESATYPWEVVRGSWSVEQFMLYQPHSPSIAFAGWVTEGSARAVLTKDGLNLDSLSQAAARRDFHPVATGVMASVRIHSALRRVESENVAARLPGRDPSLASQAVLITAHWDHKGIGPAVRGDSIYNGAEDNASGVAAILGIAKALAQLPRTARSIVFVATTAEESGLL